jgi:hypothetical protein
VKHATVADRSTSYVIDFKSSLRLQHILLHFLFFVFDTKKIVFVVIFKHTKKT